MSIATFEEALRDMLIKDAGVKAITTRCYPAKLPQNPTYPLILYYRITGIPANTLTGSPTLEYSRFQVEAWALTYAAAKALAKAIVAALNAKIYTGASVTIGSIVKQGERDQYEEAVSCHRVIMDFTVWGDE